MRAVIIEDEKRSANRLQKLLFELKPELVIVTTMESVRESVSYFSNHKPVDVIFADIQLSDGLSFDIFDQVQINAPVIFTTAYDQYAIRAFKVNGIDYLLKPIDSDELQKSLDKLTIRPPEHETPDMSQLIQMIKNQEPHSFKSRFMMKAGDRIKSISVDDIHAFYSEDKATYMVDSTGTRHLIDYSMEHLFSLLDPARFFRINRKYIVCIDAISEIHAWSNSRLKLTIKNHKDDMIIVAREKVTSFKSWLDQ